jgi:glycerol-3-phosphate dehydrogenase (NAD(P)+)
MTRVAVLGAGSWGTAFSLLLADAGNDVALWARRQEVCGLVNEKRENTEYLPGIQLPERITATHDPEHALHAAEVVVLAVPSQTLRENLTAWAELVPGTATLVSLMKGVELDTLKRMSEVIAEVTGAGPERIAVVSGPNLAREIAQREPSASVVACADEEVVTRLRRLIHSPAFRPYSSIDVIGCELGGAYKNVIALAVGMAIGLRFGDNTTASVITRGLAEIAASTRQVAEGVKSCSSLLDLANRAGVYAPIVTHVHSVVSGDMTPQAMLESLISRDSKHERD